MVDKWLSNTDTVGKQLTNSRQTVDKQLVNNWQTWQTVDKQLQNPDQIKTPEMLDPYSSLMAFYHMLGLIKAYGHGGMVQYSTSIHYS